MTEYFVRRAGAVGGNTVPQIWHDTSDPRQSVEHRQAVRLCVPLTDEIKHKYEQYLEQRNSEGVGYNRSGQEHFALSFFEWLQLEYPEKDNENAELPGKET